MRRVLACRLWQAGVDIKSLSSIKWSSAVEQMIQMDGKVTLGACSRQDNKVAFWRRLSSASGDAEETREITNPKVLELADRIVELNMLEVSDLTELLRKRLNVQTPSVPMGFAMPTSSPAAAVSAPGESLSDNMMVHVICRNNHPSNVVVFVIQVGQVLPLTLHQLKKRQTSMSS